MSPLFVLCYNIIVMTFFSLSALINFILSALLVLLVLFNKNKSDVHKGFIYFGLSISFWSISYFFWQISSNQDDALLWSKILILFAILIPAYYLQFVEAFVGVNKKKSNIAIFSFAFLFIIADFGNLLVKSVESKMSFEFWPSAGILFLPFLLYFFTLTVYAFYLLMKAYKIEEAVKKVQIKFILIGLFFGFVGGSTNYFLWYDLPIKPYGNILVSLFVLFATYAIVTKRLMDIRLVARKSFVYSAYFISITSIFVLAKFGLNGYVGERFDNLMDLLLLLLVATTTVPLKNYYFRLANKYLFSALYDPQKIISEVSENLRTTIISDELFEILHDALDGAFHLKAFGVATYNMERKNYDLVFCNGLVCKKNILPVDASIRKQYFFQNNLVSLDELRSSAPKLTKNLEALEKVGGSLFVPLNVSGKNIGLLILGQKESGDLYNEEDFSVLRVIGSQAATAIDNAMLYAEVDKFNDTLQAKVDEQTADIKAKAEHLEKLMKMRSEFLDITSHQLRTPVSVIKGVLSMIEEGSIPPDKMKQFIRGAMEKSIKLGEIINDILRASEMDSDKFVMALRPTDINEMLLKIQDDKRRTAEIKGLKMIYNIPPSIPPVMSDPKYLEHVIVNLLNNSLQYTVQGSITTSVEVTKKDVVIRVADTGIGIALDEQGKLFSKFARAKNAITTFTDGTGLGLFIIKQIIEANPGASIEIEKTELGKGTTFKLVLPIAKVVAPAV